MSRFDRFKGAIWFEELVGKDIIIGGAGGIGSFMSFFLSRLGCNIYLFDMDSFESHNMSGQLVRSGDIGKLKTDVAVDIAKDFSNHSDIEGLGKYEEDSEYCPTMISCFDNMLARKNMFKNWKKGLEENPETKDTAIFIDGRLLAEQYQIFCIKGNDVDAIEDYETNYLFDDNEVSDVDCTFKQTTHCAAAIASKMTSFLTNFASNLVDPDSMRSVPFYHEDILSINLTITENVSSIKD